MADKSIKKHPSIKSILSAAFIAVLLPMMSCEENKAAKPNMVLADARDGKKYKTVKIGTQTWMAENLNYEAEGSKCYDNKPENCNKYGRLYNWETAMKACPSGWHLPSDEEWKALDTAVGGGIKLKATKGWNNNGNGTDDYSFSALPGGNGRSDGGFGNVGYNGDWWSASERNSNYAFSSSMNNDDEIVLELLNYNKNNLFSVRCMKD